MRMRPYHSTQVHRNCHRTHQHTLKLVCGTVASAHTALLLAAGAKIAWPMPMVCVHRPDRTYSVVGSVFVSEEPSSRSPDLMAPIGIRWLAGTVIFRVPLSSDGSSQLLNGCRISTSYTRATTYLYNHATLSSLARFYQHQHFRPSSCPNIFSFIPFQEVQIASSVNHIGSSFTFYWHSRSRFFIKLTRHLDGN